MLSKSAISLVSSLRHKKYRDREALFIAEGSKLAEEALASNFQIHKIYATSTWIESNPQYPPDLIELISPQEMKKISSLTNPSDVLFLIRVPDPPGLSFTNGLYLALDSIRDPGNLGTIIRIADWYGLNQIICSLDCADIYNPKVIQSTMGSIFRIPVIYRDLQSIIKTFSGNIYGAVLNGTQNIHELKSLTESTMIIIGNESAGISEEVQKSIKTTISIPRFGHAESLNAAIATAVILDNLQRISTT